MLLKPHHNSLKPLIFFFLSFTAACAQSVETGAKPENNYTEDGSGDVDDLELEQTGGGSVERATDEAATYDSEPVDDSEPVADSTPVEDPAHDDD